MPRWPETTNAYPATIEKFPAMAAVYPPSTMARFPTQPEEWSPGSLTSATLLADYDVRKGITFRDAMLDCSATGDTITLSGTLGPYANTPHDLRVDITTSGPPGTGKFRVSINSGHDYIINSGSYDITIPVGLTYAIPGTLITLNFANVAFNANAIYVAQLDGLEDQSGNGYHATRNASNRGPLLIKAGRTNNGYARQARGITGQWAATSDGLELFDLPAALAVAACGGTNNRYHILGLVQFDALGAGAQAWVAFGSTASANPFVDFSENGASAYRHNWRNDGAAATANATYGTSDTRAHLHSCFSSDATPTSGQSDGGTAGTSATAHGALTLNIGAMFGRRRNTIDLRGVMSIVRVLIYDAPLSAGDLTIASTQLRSIHDVVIPKAIRVCYAGDSYYDAARGNGAAPNVMIHGNDLVTIVNTAATGDTISDMEATAAALDANYSAGAAGNILFVHCGMNDLGSDGTGTVATIQSALQSFIADRQATGWYVVAATFRARNDSGGGSEHPTYATKRAQFNTWLLAGSSGADAVYDDSTGAPGTLSDALWYANDGAGHPTSPEASREADLMEVQYRLYTATL